MTSAPDLPSLVAGRYVPIRLLGQGGMGAVYEVEHARTGERLALKVLLSGVGATAEVLERFKREARASARIKSEHVVRVSDADVAPELGGAPFLVMELLDGIDLERAATASLPAPATVVDWLRQVALAVDKAHGLGIVHRDLKPENLFLAKRDGRSPIVKILDFGIVKMAEDRTGGTGSGQILGTPSYMAPEQASADSRITPAADRYALGLVAYRLLTGEGYYQGNVLRIVAQLLHDPLRPPSERHPRLGAAFDAWFLRACHRWPQERFGSAFDQVEALAAALGLPAAALDVTSQPTISGEPVALVRRSRRAVPLALGSIVLATAAIGAVLAFWRPSPMTPGSDARSPQAVPAAPMIGSASTRPPPALFPQSPVQPVPTSEPAPVPSRHASTKPRSSAPRAPQTKRGTTPAAASVIEETPTADPYADRK